MIDRRRVLLAGGAAALATFGLPLTQARAAGTLRVASLKFGSLSWLLETMRAEGLCRQAGFERHDRRGGDQSGWSGRAVVG